MVDLPRVGETFGRYRIDSRVGFGGMGVVFGATDVRLGRQVALKVIGAQHAADESFRRRFEREAEIMTRLDSPHVLTIFDHGVHDGTPWLSTQLVAGGDLGRLLGEQGALDLEHAATLTGQVASALRDAHAAGVVHRDVKPSNVLLRGQDSDLHAYLCDFGIAHSGGSGLTATGGVAGSWAYMAPERTSGDPGGPASDIYSLGCLLWACLTGHAPYAGSDVEVAFAHVQAPVPQLDGKDATTLRVNAVLRRALAKDPAHRPDAEELRRELLALSRLDTDGFTATVPPDLRRGGTGTGTTLRPGRAERGAPRDEPAPPRRRRHRRRILLTAAVVGALVLVAGGFVVAQRMLDGPEDQPARLGGGTPGDVDGDGRGDLVFRWYDYGDRSLPSTDRVARSTGEGFEEPEELPRAEGLGTLGDVDGDGRADRVGVDEISSTAAGGVLVQTILADGTEREVTWAAAGNREDGFPGTADVNGDGRDDLFIYSDLQANGTETGEGTRIEVALSTDDGFEEPTTWFRAPGWDLYAVRMAPGDVDGDGTDELVVRTTASAPAGSTRELVTRLHLLRSDGSGFRRAGQPRDVPADAALMGPVDVADVDGDDAGEVIIQVAGESTRRVLVMEVSGDRVEEPTTWLRQAGDGYRDLPQDRFVTDVDGDGKADLVRLPEQGTRSFSLQVSLAEDGRFAAPEQWAEISCVNDPCEETWHFLSSGS